MRAIKHKNNYQVTKDAITASFNEHGRAAFMRGDGRGWKRGFETGALLGMAIEGVLMLVGYGIGHVFAAVFL